MLLTSLDVFGPVAGPGSLVVKQTAYAELLGGGAVPAGPVPGAGGFVAEDTVQPVAVLGRDRRISLAFAVTIVRPPRIIAALGDAAMFAGEHETVRTIEQLRPTAHALPIAIAILDIAYHARFGLARILLLLAQRACKRGKARFIHPVYPSFYLLERGSSGVIRTTVRKPDYLRKLGRLFLTAEFFFVCRKLFFFS